jgi:hypothetical protein
MDPSVYTLHLLLQLVGEGREMEKMVDREERKKCRHHRSMAERRIQSRHAYEVALALRYSKSSAGHPRRRLKHHEEEFLVYGSSQQRIVACF